MTGPSWSPDDKQIVFSGTRGGITDLYIVDADGKNLRAADERHLRRSPAELVARRQAHRIRDDRGPPDGSRAAQDREVADRAHRHADRSDRECCPNQAGLNLNPVWAPDGQSVAYISDRTGVANVFLLRSCRPSALPADERPRRSSAITEYSPAITWARGADRMAFTYYENGDYTVWAMDNPRSLKTDRLRLTPTRCPRDLSWRRRSCPQARCGATLPADSTGKTPNARGRARLGVSRAPGGSRPSGNLSTDRERNECVHDDDKCCDAQRELRFRASRHHAFQGLRVSVGFRPDYIAQPELDMAPAISTA